MSYVFLWDEGVGDLIVTNPHSPSQIGQIRRWSRNTDTDGLLFALPVLGASLTVVALATASTTLVRATHLLVALRAAGDLQTLV